MAGVKEVAEEMALLYPKLMRGLRDPSISRLRLTTVQMVILITLHELGKCKVSALAKEKRVSVATITGIIDRLVKARLVKRERDEQDRRVVFLSLTGRGMRKVNEILSLVRNRWRVIAARLTKTEREAYVKILRKLVRVLSEEKRF